MMPAGGRGHRRSWSRCTREVGLLGSRLILVDRALAFRRRQRHADRNIPHPRCDDGGACQQAAIEFGEILYAGVTTVHQ